MAGVPGADGGIVSDERVRPANVVIMRPPAYAERKVMLVWNAEREPSGLCVDGRWYAVRPSPGLRHHPGDRHQTIFEAPERP